MLHFTFFRVKIRRENFIQTTHFTTAENQQILYNALLTVQEIPLQMDRASGVLIAV